MNKDLSSLLREKILILDGAMGTLLQEKGMKPGECPELFGINHPDILIDIHKDYVAAGSHIIQSNTFGANRLKLAEYGLQDQVQVINYEAVRAARKAAGGKALVAGSIGPTGKILEPIGEAAFDDLFPVFCEQITACADAGADIISIETMTDIAELRVALIAARETTRLPVIAHLTFEEGGRTLMGTDPVAAVVILEALQPLAIGANCSVGGRELIPIIARMSAHSTLNISVEPNAGLPRLIDGVTVFPDSPEEMAEYALGLREAGANIIGGCCGSSPAHIEAMARSLRGLMPVKKRGDGLTGLASRTRVVLLGDDYPLAMIGERINPTARKKLTREIKEEKMHLIREEAVKQVEAGSTILDINMGVPGIDEAGAMKKAVIHVQSAVDVPVAIDSTDPEAIEAGLKSFVGRPLINSTTGEERHLRNILPLARKYGAAVLGLCLDESGIPEKAEGRVKIAHKIYEAALSYGLRKQDIFIDCLVKTAGAEQTQVMETIKALALVKEQLDLVTVLGVSNVSYGLPARAVLNSTYLAMAWGAGLDIPIVNPYDARIIEVYHAASVLLARDLHANRYIEIYQDMKAGEEVQGSAGRHIICSECNIPLIIDKVKPGSNLSPPVIDPVEEDDRHKVLTELREGIVKGDGEKVLELLATALEQDYGAADLLNQALVPGIEAAGDLYEKKEYFLPQLMQAAGAMKKAFTFLRPHLSQETAMEKGVILMATVEGDIHDIGKNIVCLLLENYGFRIVDLGKDIPAAEILEQAVKEHADIIGLSALMTTTMPRMKEVIEGVKEKGLKARVMVGGAVLNQEYADMIGADAYSKDAREAVNTAQRLLGLFMK